MHVLMLLRDLGLDPDGEPARAALERVRAGVVWPGWGPDGGDNPFFAGEGEPCINGQLAAAGAYFGQDVDGLVERLVGEQLADGGWNCEAENGSPARRSTPRSACWRRSWRGSARAARTRRCRSRGAGARSTCWSAGCTGGCRPVSPWWTARAAPTRAARPSPPGGTTTCSAGSSTCAPRGTRPTTGVAEAVDLVASKRRPRRPVGAGAGAPRRDAGRPRGGRGGAEPVDHPARAAGAALGGPLTPVVAPCSCRPGSTRCRRRCVSCATTWARPVRRSGGVGGGELHGEGRPEGCAVPGGRPHRCAHRRVRRLRGGDAGRRRRRHRDRRAVADRERRHPGRQRGRRRPVRRRRARPEVPRPRAAARGRSRGPAGGVGRARAHLGRHARAGRGDAGRHRRRVRRRRVVVRADPAAPGDGHRHLAAPRGAGARRSRTTRSACRTPAPPAATSSTCRCSPTRSPRTRRFSPSAPSGWRWCASTSPV